MSNTHDIVCTECKVKYWFGQSWRRGLSVYNYRDENGASYLGKFLSEHKGCTLKVEDEHSQEKDPDAVYLKWPPWGEA